MDGIESVFTNVGLDAGQSGSGTVRSKKENHAELHLRLDGGGKEANALALDRVRGVLARFPEVQATYQQPTTFTFKTPVEVEIYGYDLADLTDVSRQLADKLRKIPGLKDVTTNMEPGNPEVQIRFDRDKLKLAGLDLRRSSETLRTNILGRVATDFKDRDRQIDVRVRSDQAQTINFADLNTMVVGYHGDLPVQLASVANVTMERGPARIPRISQSGRRW